MIGKAYYLKIIKEIDPFILKYKHIKILES